MEYPKKRGTLKMETVLQHNLDLLNYCVYVTYPPEFLHSALRNF